MAVSQKQIAEDLGLSIITVSRALRDHPDLAEATKAKVVRRARELGYNRQGSFQESDTSCRLGVLVYPGKGDEESPLTHGVPFQIFTSLQRECQRLNAETLIEMPAINEVPRMVRNRTVSAVALLGRYTHQTLSLLKGVPTLAISSFIEEERLPRIVAANLDGMRLATEHLIHLGHEKITFLGSADEHTSIHKIRSHGYLVAMHENGLSPQIHFCDTSSSDILDRIPRGAAVVCSCDSLAAYVIDKLRMHGWHLPEECSIVAFDNLIELTTHYALTSYAPDWAFMGRFAANLLISQPETLKESELIITAPGKLMIRKSAIAPR